MCMCPRERVFECVYMAPQHLRILVARVSVCQCVLVSKSKMENWYKVNFMFSSIKIKDESIKLCVQLKQIIQTKPTIEATNVSRKWNSRKGEKRNIKSPDTINW